MYDLIIIGAGPAGLTASIYASCYKLNHLVIGKVIGGQLNIAPDLLNYPGFKEVTGKELIDRMVEQTKQYGAEIKTSEVVEVKKENGIFKVKTEDSKEYEGSVLILATGTERRKLHIPGEMEYTGKGVFYSAIIDTSLYENKNVVIVGGGNAGFQAANAIINKVKSVKVLEVSNTIRAEAVWQEKLKNNSKFNVITGVRTKEIQGDALWVKQVIYMVENVEKVIQTDLVIVEIGGVPGTALFATLGIKIDERGFVVVDNKMQTSVEGVFAAGDIVGDNLSMEQLSTAVGLGARAAASSYLYLKHERAPVVWGKAQIRRN